jgi:hypothetical protein
MVGGKTTFKTWKWPNHHRGHWGGHLTIFIKTYYKSVYSTKKKKKEAEERERELIIEVLENRFRAPKQMV